MYSRPTSRRARVSELGYSQLFVERASFKSTQPALEMTVRISQRFLASEMYAVMWCSLIDPMFSCFDTMLVFDRLTHRHTMTAYTVLAKHRITQ